MIKKYFEKYSNIFWIFMIGSFLGFIYENILMLIKGNYALRQGLIYEPLIPIYGIGLIIFYLLYKDLNFKNNHLLVKILKVFIIGFFMGGLTEYVGSFIQEKMFGTISWDYSYMKYDLNGRTSLFHSSIWGLMGTAFYFIVLPIINKLKELKNQKRGVILTVILSLFLLFDCSISILACNRRAERKENISSTNKLEEYLDYKYPDEYIDRIYNNAKDVHTSKNPDN